MRRSGIKRKHHSYLPALPRKQHGQLLADRGGGGARGAVGAAQVALSGGVGAAAFRAAAGVVAVGAELAQLLQQLADLGRGDARG